MPLGRSLKALPRLLSKGERGRYSPPTSSVLGDFALHATGYRTSTAAVNR